MFYLKKTINEAWADLIRRIGKEVKPLRQGMSHNAGLIEKNSRAIERLESKLVKAEASIKEIQDTSRRNRDFIEDLRVKFYKFERIGTQNIEHHSKLIERLREEVDKMDCRNVDTSEDIETLKADVKKAMYEGSHIHEDLRGNLKYKLELVYKTLEKVKRDVDNSIGIVVTKVDKNTLDIRTAELNNLQLYMRFEDFLPEEEEK